MYSVLFSLVNAAIVKRELIVPECDPSLPDSECYNADLGFASSGRKATLTWFQTDAVSCVKEMPEGPAFTINPMILGITPEEWKAKYKNAIPEDRPWCGKQLKLVINGKTFQGPIIESCDPVGQTLPSGEISKCGHSDAISLYGQAGRDFLRQNAGGEFYQGELQWEIVDRQTKTTLPDPEIPVAEQPLPTEPRLPPVEETTPRRPRTTSSPQAEPKTTEAKTEPPKPTGRDEPRAEPRKSEGKSVPDEIRSTRGKSSALSWFEEYKVQCTRTIPSGPAFSINPLMLGITEEQWVKLYRFASPSTIPWCGLNLKITVKGKVIEGPIIDTCDPVGYRSSNGKISGKCEFSDYILVHGSRGKEFLNSVSGGEFLTETYQWEIIDHNALSSLSSFSLLSGEIVSNSATTAGMSFVSLALMMFALL
jgi:hypothetical protein